MFRSTKPIEKKEFKLSYVIVYRHVLYSQIEEEGTDAFQTRKTHYGVTFGALPALRTANEARAGFEQVV